MNGAANRISSMRHPTSKHQNHLAVECFRPKWLPAAAAPFNLRSELATSLYGGVTEKATMEFMRFAAFPQIHLLINRIRRELARRSPVMTEP